MRVKMPHAPYIARKVGIDLYKCGFVKFISGMDPVVLVVKDLLLDDIQKEKALEERVKEVLDQNENEIDFMQVDRRNMFWLVKKKLAKDFDVILSFDDRYSDLSHKILSTLSQKNLIAYSVSENRIKNTIYASIENYIKTYEDIEDIVADRISNYKHKLVLGTQEYEFVFEKLYEEELHKRGML